MLKTERDIYARTAQSQRQDLFRGRHRAAGFIAEWGSEARHSLAMPSPFASRRCRVQRNVKI
jgi:hypothetical protein